MTARVREIWSDVRALVGGLSPARRAVVVAGVGAALGLVLAVVWWVQRPFSRPLFTSLGREDAAAITAALDADRVPYELADDGRSVLVPADRVSSLRLALASRGLPGRGDVGVDGAERGAGDVAEHASRRRALEAELARTIADVDGVELARVHVAMPDASAPATPDRHATASVVVRLAPGRTLGAGQVDGIVHLVAASVAGLAPEAVTVLDAGGRLLAGAGGDGDALATSSGALRYQRSIERATEARIESLLTTIVGAGKVVARVAATVDFARTERDEDTYDPDKTVVLESHSSRDDAAGKPAAVTGAPAASTPAAARRDESQRYAVSKTTSRTVIPVGGVKSLSVAVLVDGTYREQNGTRVFAPRPDDELAKLRTLVASAIGISEARGDRLELTSAQFQVEAPEATGGLFAQAGRWLPALAARALGIVFVLGVLATVVRPLANAIATAGPRTRPRPATTVVDREGAVELARENVALAQQNPERAAQLVRQWLHDGTQRTA